MEEEFVRYYIDFKIKNLTNVDLEYQTYFKYLLFLFLNC